MKARLLAFVIWAAVAASVVFWVMRVVTKPPGAPAYTNPISGLGGGGGDLSRVLGAPKVQAAAVADTAPQSSRFQLLGVVAPKASGSSQGVALIAIDGKPARAFRVGAVVDGEWVVQSVHSRGAALGPREGAAGMRLALPPLSVAATGTLPGPVNRYTPPPVVPRPGSRLPPGAVQGGYPQRAAPMPEAAMPPEAQEEMPAEAEGEPDAEPAQSEPN